MIIRSQDKASIRNFNLISDLVISKNNKHWEIVACYPYFAQSDCAFSVIGRYSTEEKAIKVLDMIQQKYLEYSSSSGGSINQYSAIPPTAFIPPKVFQMPQDSEV